MDMLATAGRTGVLGGIADWRADQDSYLNRRLNGNEGLAAIRIGNRHGTALSVHPDELVFNRRRGERQHQSPMAVMTAASGPTGQGVIVISPAKASLTPALLCPNCQVEINPAENWAD